MVSFVRNLLCLTILTVLASTGYAIHCYRCDTFYNDCKRNPSKLIDCSTVTPPDHLSELFKVGKATGCMKLQYASMIQQRTRYDCYFGDVSNKQGCELSVMERMTGYTLACDVCTEDSCNGSGSLAPIAGAIILFLGVVHLFAP
ncbi:uncharacterized protein LOC133848115 [Drosophila sulfurigaster albostrigata]|uniref:uncharacterized protein LOC133848115 n=1 Tax=Drosophila sulfurigaster albostrigata TaxID=89887 RepID=UPI002D218D96|nr:uncharacterized protein LOC133848115 [Drosophila sulfurigaster albostrigata]